jgi:hypothetical protein
MSDGNQFYEVPSLSTLPSYFEPSLYSEFNIKMNSAPTSALPSTHATSSASAGASNASNATSLASLHSWSVASAGFVGPQTALSEEEARAQIEAYIRTSSWFQLHEMETLIGGPGVPACASQLAPPGHSIWACFFKKVRRDGTLVFKCITCGHESHRLHRAVNHQRAKWGHKPFPCTDSGW